MWPSDKAVETHVIRLGSVFLRHGVAMQIIEPRGWPVKHGIATSASG